MWNWISERLPNSSGNPSFTRHGPFGSKEEAERWGDKHCSGSFEVVKINTTNIWEAGRYIKAHLSEIWGTEIGTARQVRTEYD